MAAGKKHRLLIYERTMRRLWRSTLVLSLELFAIWWYGGAFTSLYRPQLDSLVLAGAFYSAGFSLFAWISPRMGYVRAFDDFLLIATPFLRFKTSYERIRGVRSVDFYKLFDVDKLSWAEDRYTLPFVGMTAVVVKLTRYPLSRKILDAFFHRYLFSPQDAELVLLVDDWMGFSLELDSRYNEYRQRRRRKVKVSGFQRGT